MDAHVKYVTYECDTCKRQKEIQLDGRRPDPIHCTITQNCRGKLSRIGLRSTKQFLFTPIVPALQDYVPRGSPVTVNQPTVPQQLITISTSRDDILVMAVLPSLLPVDGNGYLTLSLFEITSQVLSFKKYTYKVNGAIQVISGPDDSIGKLNLRFLPATPTRPNPSTIQVFINGVEILEKDAIYTAPGADGQPFTFSRVEINQQIIFSPEYLIGTNNVVEVLVYDSIDFNATIDPANITTLNFTPLSITILSEEALRAKSCWGDYKGVKINGVTRQNLFCTDTTLLSPNKTYGVLKLTSTFTGDNQVNNQDVVTDITPPDFFILLGKEPFAFQDKELFAYVTSGQLIIQSTLLYNQSPGTGDIQLSIDGTQITQLINPMIPISHLVITPAATTQMSTAQGAEELKKTYIRGPS